MFHISPVPRNMSVCSKKYECLYCEKRLAYENILAFRWMRMGKLKNSLLKTMFRVACTSVGCFSFQLHSEPYPIANVLDTWLHPTTGLHLDYSTIYGELRDEFVTSGAPLMQGVSFDEKREEWERRKQQWEQKYDKWCLLSSERLGKVYKCEQDWNPHKKGLPGYKFIMSLFKNGSICNSRHLCALHPFGINVFARSMQADYETKGELNMDEKTRENLTTCMYVISSEHFLRKILGDAVVDKFADGFDSVMEDVKANGERLQRGIDIHHEIFLTTDSGKKLNPTVIVKSYFRDFSPIDAQRATFYYNLTLQFTINIESNVLEKIELFEYDNGKFSHFHPKNGVCL